MNLYGFKKLIIRATKKNKIDKAIADGKRKTPIKKEEWPILSLSDKLPLRKVIKKICKNLKFANNVWYHPNRADCKEFH